MWSYHILDFGAPSQPSPHKISNNILIYLTSYRILARPLSVPLKSLSIVASGKGGGGAKSYKR